MTNPVTNQESNLFRSEFQSAAPRIAPEKTLFIRFLFVAAMGMTLFDGAWLWAARAGWTLLAILFSINVRLGFYALFFFAAWFHPTGFMPELFFTLKHFQIAFLISLIVHTLYENPFKTLASGLNRAGSFFYPWFLILAIGFFNFFRFPDISEQAIMTPMNILCNIAAMLYLLGRCEQIKIKFPQEKTVRNCLSFFVAGVAFQVLIAFQNTVAGSLYFNMPLFHNNHIGILCAFSSFFSIALVLSEQNAFIKKIWSVATFILISAVIASCSRTAWFSFFAAYMIFFVLAKKFRPEVHPAKMRKRDYLSVAVFALAAALVLSNAYEIVGRRFMGVLQLFDWKYWEYTFTDTQNFGFLGILRLKQIYVLKDILTAQPFLGMGFIKEVMDFHGFYFSLLGGVGVAGFATFVYFCRQTLNVSLERIAALQDRENFFFLLSAFCAFIVWLLCCFLETYIHQFSVWIIFWVLCAIMYPVWAPIPDDEN